MTRLPPLAAGLVAVALAGCGGSGSTSPAPAPPAASTSTAPTEAGPAGPAVHVTMKDLAFTPKTIHAKVGESVDWTNDDSVTHNVSYVSGPKFSSSRSLKPGQSFFFKATHAGTIHYVCTIHPFMTGTIVVTK